MYCWLKTGRNRSRGLPSGINIDHIAAVADSGINIFFRMHDPP